MIIVSRKQLTISLQRLKTKLVLFGLSCVGTYNKAVTHKNSVYDQRQRSLKLRNVSQMAKNIRRRQNFYVLKCVTDNIYAKCI